MIKLRKDCLMFLILCLVFTATTSQSASDQIKLNQLGFYTYAPKVAAITSSPSSPVFFVINQDSKDTVHRGKLSHERQSLNSSLKTHIADFSAFQSTGIYILFVPGIGYSYPFTINDQVLRTIAIASLKGYYYQRISMPLEEKYAGKWKRPAGHADMEVLIHPSAASQQRPAGTKISSPGGWYDAGDYNKYIVNSGITMGTLLSAYEDFPAHFDKLSTNIPETNDAIPDILNEILYNLRWMLTMQDPHDGGVYHKCTNAAFDGMVMPGVTTAPRYVVQKGTAASLDFAAVMAQSARILRKFKKQLPGLADTCLKAATTAWAWSQNNPALIYNQNAINSQHEPKITTGAYGDRDFKDEWLWAAAELYTLTKDKQYQSVLAERINDSMQLPTWGNVRMLGFYSLIRHEKLLPLELSAAIRSTKTKLVIFADRYLQSADQNAFQTVMGQSRRDFNWGSNSNAANQGVVLINAYFITKNKKYLDYALGNLDYLLGRNATGYCFVTGLGSKSPMYPHHRPSVADKIPEPVPGLLAGGPNPGRQDKCKYEYTEPETAYTDLECSYASNEIAINWNAPLVYLANAIEALKYNAGYAKR
jgi:endoglucanase